VFGEGGSLVKTNLYRNKKPVLKWSSFLVLTIALLAPVFAVRFTIEFYKKSTVDILASKYTVVVQKYDISVKSTSLASEIERVKSLNNSMKIMAANLQRQINAYETHLKRLFESDSLLKTIFGVWVQNSEDWMVLSHLDVNDSKVSMTFFELYNPKLETSGQMLEEKLTLIGYEIQKSIDYDVEMSFQNKNVTRITLEGER